ncbi:MAG TPA: hypothetical protein DE045_12585 [Oceanospirillaceae bacterium]|nr:hypothetical protein [Oceanospirillaceae bacterium]
MSAAVLFPALLMSAWAHASTYQQGQLVVGQVEPGVQVWLNGQPLPVSNAGLYAFGLGRNAKANGVITTRRAGVDSEQALSVTKRRYPEQKINGLPAKKVTPDPEVGQRISADNQQIGAVRASQSQAEWLGSSWIMPVQGRISGVYGARRILNGVPKSPHNGVDIAAAAGTAIVAPIAGRVALVHEDMFYTGKTLMLDHGLGVTSVYAHMQSINVHFGQLVQQGEVLGTVGQTGRATGPHLHWGVTWQRTHVDPLLLVD